MAVAKKKKWKMFEELVAKVQADLAADAIVKLNQKILGKISKEKDKLMSSFKKM
jgi:hypothetical protein